MADNALKHITYGIYFLGSRKPDGVNGMIASWVTQVSFDPRRVAVGVKKERYSHDLIKDSGVFSLCVLGKEFKDKLNLFKSDKTFEGNSISGYEYETLETGAPVLINSIAFMELKLVDAIDAGDHTLFIGEVVNEGVKGGGEPLVTWDLEGHYYGG